MRIHIQLSNARHDASIVKCLQINGFEESDQQFCPIFMHIPSRSMKFEGKDDASQGVTISYTATATSNVIGTIVIK